MKEFIIGVLEGLLKEADRQFSADTPIHPDLAASRETLLQSVAWIEKMAEESARLKMHSFEELGFQKLKPTPARRIMMSPRCVGKSQRPFLEGKNKQGKSVRELIDEGHLCDIKIPLEADDTTIEEDTKLWHELHDRPLSHKGGDYDREALDKASYNDQEFFIAKGSDVIRQGLAAREHEIGPDDLGKVERLTYSAELVFVDSEDQETIEAGHVADLEECAQRSNIFFEDVMPQIGGLCIQDFANVNELGILLTKLNKS